MVDTAYKPETIREALRLLSEGVPATRIAKSLATPASTIRRWKNRYSNLTKIEDIAAAAKALPGVGRPREQK